MELFTPEVGLIIWMFIPFLLVFFVLAKFGWPVIMKGVEERNKFIDDSVQSAKMANEQLVKIKVEGEQLLAGARDERLHLLKEANEMKDLIIKEAKTQAGTEAEKMVNEARIVIQKEKENAIRDIRSQVAELSIEIAEKIIRKQLDNKPDQMDFINKLLDESAISKS